MSHHEVEELYQKQQKLKVALTSTLQTLLSEETVTVLIDTVY